MNTVSHTYKQGIQDLGRTDLPAGNVIPFPIPPGRNYTLAQAHTQARADLDTSTGRAPLTEYFVRNGIVAHENAHVTHFYSPDFDNWNTQMELFKSEDIEGAGVFIIYDCSDASTTSAASAMATMRATWDPAIAEKHRKAIETDSVDREAYAYSIENAIEAAVRATIPIP